MADKQTLIEEGTEFEGTMTSSCSVVVKGRVQGNLSTPSLLVSPGGAVHGKAQVGDLKSDGELSGEFDAESVELSGSVKDNTIIRAKTLEVKLQSQGKMQVVFGETELQVGAEPKDDGNEGGGGDSDGSEGKADGDGDGDDS